MQTISLYDELNGNGEKLPTVPVDLERHHEKVEGVNK